MTTRTWAPSTMCRSSPNRHQRRWSSAAQEFHQEWATRTRRHQDRLTVPIRATKPIHSVSIQPTRSAGVCGF